MVKHASRPRSSFYMERIGKWIHLTAAYCDYGAKKLYIKFTVDLIISNILFSSATFPETFQAVEQVSHGLPFRR